MSETTRIEPAIAALDDGDAAVEKLHASCCDPGRSPRMIEVEETLARARAALDLVGDEPGTATAALHELEEAGALVGRLQVLCCTPKRMPLYARILEDLTAAQLAIAEAVGTGH